MKKLLATALLLSLPAMGQDMDFVRQWERMQRMRPANIGSSGRIASANEPGTPLVINGHVFLRDGVRPAADVIVFAYQTDKHGVYNRGSNEGWRLYGWAKTDKDGRFEFRTIRPGPYPESRTPAHIHLSIEGPSLPRRWVPEIQFENDLFLSAADRKKSAAAGKFGSIRGVAFRAGVQYVDFNIRIEESGRF